MPPHQKRKEVDVRSQLGKEIQLKHRAPVLSVTVIDANSMPLHKDSMMPHRVLICSEEQFKVSNLKIILMKRKNCAVVFTFNFFFLGIYFTQLKTIG